MLHVDCGCLGCGHAYCMSIVDVWAVGMLTGFLGCGHAFCMLTWVFGLRTRLLHVACGCLGCGHVDWVFGLWATLLHVDCGCLGCGYGYCMPTVGVWAVGMLTAC